MPARREPASNWPSGEASERRHMAHWARVPASLSSSIAAIPRPLHRPIASALRKSELCVEDIRIHDHAAEINDSKPEKQRQGCDDLGCRRCVLSRPESIGRA